MTPELSQAYAAAEIATEKVARLTERVRELEAVLQWYANALGFSKSMDYRMIHEDGGERATRALAKREG